MSLPTPPGRKLPTKNKISSPEQTSIIQKTEDEEQGYEVDYEAIIKDNMKIAHRLKGTASITGVQKDEFVGSLTSKDLMLNSWKKWESVEEPISDLTDLIRQLLSDSNKSESVEKARQEGGEEYKKMILNIEAMVLKEINKTSQGTNVSRFHVPREFKSILIARVVNEIMGLGPLEPLYADEAITEIMVNGFDDVQVEIAGDLYKVPGVRFRDDEHLYNLCSSMLQAVGRKINVREPLADGRLIDKSRINVTHPNIGGGKTNLTLRRHPTTSWTIKDMVGVGAMTEEIAQELAFLIYNGCSAIIIGGTGSGKTSALNALSGAFPLKDRILTIEDSMELKLNPKRTVLPFEARQASSSGENAISIRDLVKNSLRMRPDRIIIGEVRDGTAYDMLQAMNTGHDGSMTTIHANDALAGVDRLANLATESGSIDHSGVNSLIAGAVDLFIVVRKYHEDKSRRIAGVYEIPNRPSINRETGLSSLDPRPLWEWIHTDTNDDGTIEGHYEKINEPSEGLVKKKRLDTARRMNIDEVYELSNHSV